MIQNDVLHPPAHKNTTGDCPTSQSGCRTSRGRPSESTLFIFFPTPPFFFFSFPPSTFPSTSIKDQAWPRTGSVNVIRLEIAKKKIIERLVLLNEAPMSHTVCWVAFFIFSKEFFFFFFFFFSVIIILRRKLFFPLSL